MYETKVFINFLTFVGVLDESLKKIIEESRYFKFGGYLSNYGFKHAYTGLKDEHLELGDEKFRLEFNFLNGDIERMKKIISVAKEYHLSRLDISVDYSGINLSKFDWVSEQPKKKCIYFDANGVVETIQIGAPSSSLQFMIFDKIAEQSFRGEEASEEKPHNDWRITARNRFKINVNNLSIDDYLPYDLFNIKSCSKNLNLDFLESPKERIIVRGLLEEPSEIHNLNKKTKTKYNNIIKLVRNESSILKDLEPNSLYLKERSSLIDDLRYFGLK